MIINLLIMAIVLAVGVLILASFQPSDFRIERSVNIAAPDEAIFPHVNDLHRWEAWSPWAKLDPSATVAYSGAPSGMGAVYTWSGNNKVGEGKMTIIESHPSDLIRLQLDFLRPFKDTSTAEFTIKPQANQTVVTWAMYGERKYVGKVVCLFVSMEKLVGGQFAQGLSQLKAVVEKQV